MGGQAPLAPRLELRRPCHNLLSVREKFPECFVTASLPLAATHLSNLTPFWLFPWNSIVLFLMRCKWQVAMAGICRNSLILRSHLFKLLRIYMNPQKLTGVPRSSRFMFSKCSRDLLLLKIMSEKILN